jgi:type IV pilus assembly protein PilF
MPFRLSIAFCLLSFLMSGCAQHSQAEVKELLALADEYRLQNNPVMAKCKLEAALKMDDANPVIYDRLGEHYLSTGNHTLAFVNFEKAYQLDNDNPRYLSHYAQELCTAESFEPAIKLLKNYLASAEITRPWETQTVLGNCYQQQNQTQAAFQTIQKALSLKEDYPAALELMQKLHYQNRNFPAAQTFWRKLVQKNKPSVDSIWIAFQTERALGNSYYADQLKRDIALNYPKSHQAEQIKKSFDH